MPFTETKLRDWLSYFLVFAKLLVIIWLFLIGSFSRQQILDTLAIIVPLFSVHISVIIKYYLDQQNKPRENKPKTVSRPLVVLSWIFAFGYLPFS